MLTAKGNDYPKIINFEETELRLGLPGGGDVEKDNDNQNLKSNGKRGFSEIQAVDLKLQLSNSSTATRLEDNIKRDGDDKEKEKPPAKAQVVGWPPVRSFRKNIMAVQKATTSSDTDKGGATSSTTASAALVKVSMDGAPYLRKVDLKMYKSYQELSHALATMFGSFSIQAKESTSHSEVVDPVNGSEYVSTYEDKDGDWMLIGDVPWKMFVESCKRLRIMKGSEAIGLAPRGSVQECKSLS